MIRRERSLSFSDLAFLCVIIFVVCLISGDLDGAVILGILSVILFLAGCFETKGTPYKSKNSIDYQIREEYYIDYKCKNCGKTSRFFKKELDQYGSYSNLKMNFEKGVGLELKCKLCADIEKITIEDLIKENRISLRKY